MRLTGRHLRQHGFLITTTSCLKWRPLETWQRSNKGPHRLHPHAHTRTLMNVLWLDPLGQKQKHLHQKFNLKYQQRAQKRKFWYWQVGKPQFARQGQALQPRFSFQSQFNTVYFSFLWHHNVKTWQKMSRSGKQVRCLVKGLAFST